MVYYDGQVYESETDIPDFGSIECTAVTDYNKRQYQALQADLIKLPKYVSTGSTCIMIDTGNVYVFSAKRQSWEPLGG